MGVRKGMRIQEREREREEKEKQEKEIIAEKMARKNGK